MESGVRWAAISKGNSGKACLPEQVAFQQREIWGPTCQVAAVGKKIEERGLRLDGVDGGRVRRLESDAFTPEDFSISL